MAERADSPTSTADALAALLQEEVYSCQAILRATEDFTSALEPLDVTRLEAAVAERSREVERLRQLEKQVEALRAEQHAVPSDLAPGIAGLRDLSARIRGADASAKAASAGVLGALRQGLRTVALGQQGLKGYRSHPDAKPRFADKRG